MDPTTVTVFGGTGFVGRRAVARLAAAGWKVRVVARHPLPPDDPLHQHWGQTADIRDPDAVAEAVRGAHAVVNAVSLYVETPDASFESIHSEGAERLARCAREAGVTRLVHISGLGANPASSSRYIAARGRGEARVRAAFPAATLLRPSVIFGPHDAFLRALDGITRAPVVLLFGAGRTRLQPVYVDDVAAAVAGTLERPDATGRVFELGGGAVYTYREIIEQVLTARRRWRPLAPVPFAVWKMAAAVASRLPDPPLTPDQVALMETDSVVTGHTATFTDLGIEPVRLEDKLTSCLPDRHSRP